MGAVDDAKKYLSLRPLMENITIFALHPDVLVAGLLDEIEKLREERNQLRKVLRMWVDFWVADNSIDVGGDALLAEEAMEATREILRDDNV
jgi:hypothetical protein